ncbi:LEVG family PEP-CTERM protein [Anabaena catenula]|uniref:LEVG family PEP-CTERM protein n=1 Tax=Anabaena catenula FACHB-362 TaxID=2692877 RepID=A0ABR8J8A8_9NOST|nr:LEVG family PEP-CTERM protein [Anabaena catenula]MBD2694079.1 LEVG family PEP-CTERM protein [Anabaena catenula FACHB-362]
MTSFKYLVTTVAVSTLGLSLFGGLSQAQAASLVPSTEGEVINSEVNGSPLGYTITSLDYDGPGGNKPSRLFVDDRTTENDYGSVKFGKLDVGTNPDGFWFRPVAVDSKGNPVENKAPLKGQLEVGKFNFNFGAIAKTLKLSFFDVEDIGTLINNIVGTGVNPANISIAPGADSNIQTVILNNVTSFDLKLGLIGGAKFPLTGDGVRLKIETVPEPTTILGLGALGLAGAFGLRKGKKSSPVV